MKTADGRSYVVGGASRSGKTAWVAQHCAAHRRIAAWDPDDQWGHLPGWRSVRTKAEFLSAMKKPGPVKIAFYYRPTRKGEQRWEGFEFWAQAVYKAGRYVEPLAVIAEELAAVTSPSKAPPWWGEVTRTGLKRGITIYAISQRWSEADKTAFGNASLYVIFRQSSEDDARYFARKTSIPLQEIIGLKTEFHPGTEDVKTAHYITRNTATHEINRGALRFRRRR